MGNNNPVDKVNLYAYKDSRLDSRLEVVDADDIAIDLSNYTAKMQIRDVDDVLIYTGTSDDDLSISPTSKTDDNGDTIYAVDLGIPGATVGSWSFTSEKYDLFVISSDDKPFAVSRGRIRLYPATTQIT